MLWEDKDLTLEKTINLVDEYAVHIDDVMDVVIEAFMAAFRTTGEDSKNEMAPEAGSLTLT